VTGADIMKKFKLTPGPLVWELIVRAFDWVINDIAKRNNKKDIFQNLICYLNNKKDLLEDVN
jgi:hypothetical protein